MKAKRNLNLNSLRKIYFFLLGLACMIFLNQSSGFAQKAEAKTKDQLFKHAINSCPAAPAFGIYSINYEYLVRPNHGIVLRFDYENIPKRFEQKSVTDQYQNTDIEARGMGPIINYRYHVSGKMNSLFVGLYGRFRFFSGTGKVESTEFEFKIPEWSAGINLGKRWVFKSGFNITFGAGYGISQETWESTPNNSAIESVLDAFKSSYDFFNPFYGEFSIGYAF